MNNELEGPEKGDMRGSKKGLLSTHTSRTIITIKEVTNCNNRDILSSLYNISVIIVSK